MDFLSTPINRDSISALALSIYIVAALWVGAPMVYAELAQVPWDHLPPEVAKTSLAYYDATFMRAAEYYLVAVDGIGDLQADAYQAAGEGLASGAAATIGLMGLDGVGEWYQDSSKTLEKRLGQ